MKYSRYTPRTHHRSKKGFIAVLLLVMIAGLIIWQPWNIGKPRVLGKYTLMPFTAEDNFEPFGTGAAYLKDNSLYFVNSNGKFYKGYKNAVDGLKLRASGGRLAVYGMNKLQLFNEEGLIVLNKDLEGKIQDVRCGRSMIAANINTAEGLRLQIINYLGTSIDVLAVSDGQVLVDYDFSSDGRTLWVLSSEIGASPIYRLTTYEYTPTKSITGTINLSDELPCNITIHEDKTYISGTSGLTTYDHNAKLISSFTLNGMEYAAEFSGEAYYTAFRPAGAVFNRLTLTKNGQAFTAIRTAPGAAKAVLGHSKAYVFNAEGMTVTNFQGRSAIKYLLPNKPDRVIPLNGEYILMVSGNDVYSIKLP